MSSTQQAAQNKRGLFIYPDEAHLLLLAWKFRSGIVHMTSYRGSSRQVDLCMQKGKFFKVCVLYETYEGKGNTVGGKTVGNRWCWNGSIC